MWLWEVGERRVDGSSSEKMMLAESLRALPLDKRQNPAAPAPPGDDKQDTEDMEESSARVQWGVGCLKGHFERQRRGCIIQSKQRPASLLHSSSSSLRLSSLTPHSTRTRTSIQSQLHQLTDKPGTSVPGLAADAPQKALSSLRVDLLPHHQASLRLITPPITPHNPQGTFSTRGVAG